jgi:hypothetical protein
MRTLTIIFILSLIFTQICFASEQFTLSNNQIKEEESSLLLDAFGLLLGAGIQIVVHEGGHWLGAKIVDREIKFKDDYIGGFDIIDRKTDTKEEERIISMSGFLLPLTISELALDLAPNDNPFVVGLILGMAVHNTFYLIQDISGGVNNNDYNDFEVMEQAGLGRGITQSVLIAASVIQIGRLCMDKNFKSKWGFGVGASENGINMAMNYKF